VKLNNKNIWFLVAIVCIAIYLFFDSYNKYLLEKKHPVREVYDERVREYRFNKNNNAYKGADEYNTYYLDDPDAYKK